MTAPVFVDTNVLVYRFDSGDPTKQRCAEQWLDHLWRFRLGRLSTQVQHELYTTLTRKLTMPREDARRIVTALEAWSPVVIHHDIVQRAWRLEDEHALSWRDALIVAAARASSATTLLTEDLQAGRTYGGIRVVNPFEEPPPEQSAHDTPDPTYG